MRYWMILLLLLSHISLAAVYVKQDNDGNLIYSDTQEPGAIAITVPEVSGTTTVQQSNMEIKSKDKKTREIEGIVPENGYKHFRIVSPQEQENIQNQPLVTVNLEIDPELREGDKIQLILDGKPWGAAAVSTRISIPLEERGKHELSAVVIDGNQKVIQQSSSVTFYVHRNSVITSPASR